MHRVVCLLLLHRVVCLLLLHRVVCLLLLYRVVCLLGAQGSVRQVFVSHGGCTAGLRGWLHRGAIFRAAGQGVSFEGVRGCTVGLCGWLHRGAICRAAGQGGRL